MNRFYSTLGIDQAIKEQEEDNIETNNKINYMKDWKESLSRIEMCDQNSKGCSVCLGEWFSNKNLEILEEYIKSLLSQQRKDILTELRLKLRNTYKAEDIADTAFLTESDLESVLKK